MKEENNVKVKVKCPVCCSRYLEDHEHICYRCEYEEYSYQERAREEYLAQREEDQMF